MQSLLLAVLLIACGLNAYNHWYLVSAVLFGEVDEHGEPVE